MESNSMDSSSVLSLTMMEEDEHPHHQFSSISKMHNNGPTITSVHDLLECPVCTNSMYPPIHQVTEVSFAKDADLFPQCSRELMVRPIGKDP